MNNNFTGSSYEAPAGPRYYSWVIMRKLLAGELVGVQAANSVPALDVSHWQGELDQNFWDTAWLSGYRVAFIKATEGKDFLDSRYLENAERARLAGLIVVAYHFARPGVDWGSQWSHAKNVVGTTAVTICLDLERDGNEPQVNVNMGVTWFLQKAKEHYGVAILYSAAWFLNPRPQIDPQTDYLRWTAHYTTYSDPYLPFIWRDAQGWDAWQYTDRGTIGSKYPLDLNRIKPAMFATLQTLSGEKPEDLTVEAVFNLPAGVKLDVQINQV